MTYDDELLNAALEYLDRGWSIIPMSGKVPLVDWKKYQERLPTQAEVEQWFTEFSGFGLALVCGALSGVVVVDADTPEAVEWCKANGLTSPFSVRSRRGRHFYFAHPRDGRRFANVHHNKLRGGGLYGVPHLDFKGDGGYVVLPPTISHSAEKGDWRYEWEPMVLDWDDCPIWTPRRMAVEPEGSFDITDLDLSGVRVGDVPVSIREEAERAVAEHGPFRDGDGRNTIMIRFAGEQVRRGVLGEALEAAARDFQATYFADPLDDVELLNTLRSAEAMDRRNHPEDYDASGRRLEARTEAFENSGREVAKRLRTITTADLSAIEATLGEQRYILEPWLPEGSIVQIAGYTGSGKSLLTQAALWSAALGKDFGPWECQVRARTLYLDYEMSAHTIVHRMRMMERGIGNAGDGFQIWAPSLISVEEGGVMDLRTKAGLATLQELCIQVRPDVVVIDTVRSAFPGLEENKAEAWAPLNQLVLRLRNAGASVVVLHHRNKPGEGGLGREAGSTNQLSNIETQLFVTPLFDDEDRARELAGKYDPEKWNALANEAAKQNCRLLTAIEVSYGKTRARTDLHHSVQIGFCEHLIFGKRTVVSSTSLKQKARILSARGASIADIAMALRLPSQTIKDWLHRRA